MNKLSREFVEAQMDIIAKDGVPPSVKDLGMQQLMIGVLLDIRDALAFPVVTMEGEEIEPAVIAPGVFGGKNEPSPRSRAQIQAVGDSCVDPLCPHGGTTHSHD